MLRAALSFKLVAQGAAAIWNAAITVTREWGTMACFGDGPESGGCGRRAEVCVNITISVWAGNSWGWNCVVLLSLVSDGSVPGGS
jgi:hypothetical protein